MSNRQLDEINEEKRDKYVAEELGLTLEEIQETKYTIDTNESNDGLIYSYIVRFSDNSPEHILSKIPGLENNQVIIDYIPDDEDEEFDPNDDGDDLLSDEERKIAEQEMFRIAEENRRRGLQ